MKLTFVALLMGCLTLTSAACAQEDPGGDTRKSLMSGGLERSYEIHVPPGAAPAEGFPVILAFHGGGGRGDSMRRLGKFDVLADVRRFIVVYPDGLDKHWNDGRSTIKRKVDDVGFVSDLLDRIAADYPVDKRRVFATGISNGALFSERLACDLAPRIAAIAAVAGTLPADLAPACKPARHVAVMQIDGTTDPIMPYDGGEVYSFLGMGEGGNVQSVNATAAFWAHNNGCEAAGAEEMLPPALASDDTRVKVVRYRGCAPDGPVSVYSVVGGGHAWPGGAQYAAVFFIGRASQQLQATQTIVDFFLGLPPR